MIMATWRIAIYSEGEYHFDSPGLVAQAFGDFRGTSSHEASRNFPSYSHGSFEVFDTGQFTVADALGKIASQAGFFNNLCFLHSIGEPYLQNCGLLYRIDDSSLSIFDLAHRFGKEDKLDLLVVFNGDAGEVFHGEDAGYYYCFHSSEGRRHAEPHLHINYRHDYEGSFSLYTGEQIAGKRFPRRAARHAKKKILENRDSLIREWNRSTDGIMADIDHALKRLGHGVH